MHALVRRPAGLPYALAVLLVGAAGCSGGGGGPECAPAAEVCNGVDDDCDGEVDEGNPGGGAGCATGLAGACAAGTLQCDGGSLDCVQSTGASAELCNGIDDDCDGAVDQADPGGGAACDTGLFGACAAGVAHCVGGSVECVQAAASSAELCNGRDDDCDGVVDEGNPGGGTGCTTGLAGACAAGTLECVGGSLLCAQATAARAELCNGVDDDCDGAVDQGDPGGGAACQTGLLGACAAGVEHCAGGSIRCVQAVASSAEVCNARDDDCDGAIDEGNPGGGVACSTGLRGVCDAGTTVCNGGSIQCAQTVLASAEACNGLDDDCDGTVDEGNPGSGVACTTGLPGVCGAGTTGCTGGAIRCTQSELASDEICNGLDDDCDGAVDEGNPGGGVACTTGLPGVCAAGTTACRSGAVECQQTTPAGFERCNGLDDDCDGIADEDFGAGIPCSAGVGACAADGVRVCKVDGTGTVCSAVPGTPVTEICDNRVDDDCDGLVDEGCPWRHTIAIDGVNDFGPASEGFLTTSTGYWAYVTWDSGYLYVGYDGADLASGDASKWLVIDLDDRTDGLSAGQMYGTQQPAFPAGFLGDHEVALRLDATPSSLIGFEVRGASWAAWSASPAITWARSGTYLELAIPFAALGDPPAVGVTARILDEQAGAEWTYAGLYTDAFSDGYDPDIAKYLLASRTSIAAPSSAANFGPTCVDGVKNGSETDVDCGGSCAAKCALAKGCAAPTDCASAACAAGVCVAKTCSDLHLIQPASPTGTYTIAPDGTTGATVSCDMTTDGGGWTIVSINGLLQTDGTCQFRLASDAPACGTFPSFSSDWQLAGSVMGAIPFRAVLIGTQNLATGTAMRKITVDAAMTVGAGTFTGTPGNPSAAQLWCLGAPVVGTYGVTVNASGYTVFGPVDAVAGAACPQNITYDLGLNPPKTGGTRESGWSGDALPVCGCGAGQATSMGSTSVGWFGLR